MGLDPKALEAARKAVGTIPGAWLWNDVEAAILAYLQHAGEGGAEPVAWRYRDAWGQWAYCQAVDNVNGPTVITEKQALYAHPTLITDTPVAEDEDGKIAVPIDKLLAVRDALAESDVNEAWHQLYSLADPAFQSMTPWAEWERLAAAAPKKGGE